MKPIAVMPMCNFGGLAIMEIIHGIDDKVVVCDSYGDGYKHRTVHKLYTSTKGTYFRRYGKRYYLDDFMKI